jgi:ADP-heptose:LPS heptosyltransferase
LTSTSCDEIARKVLADCIDGRAPERLPRELTDPLCTRALFGILAEGLGDRFEPALCDVYARLFAPAIPGADPDRYFRIRVPRPIAFEPRRVFILSRITLGADIAVTSVIMDGAKRRWPSAEIVFVGPHKNWELFAADPRLTHAPLTYRRDAYLDVWRELQSIVGDDLVLDPDSRLTQLGLLPVGCEDCYHFFESRSYGGDSDRALSQLAAQWIGVLEASPYLALQRQATPSDIIAVSLGVGENLAKRIPDPFEAALLKLLAARSPVYIDRGGGGEEAERVGNAVQAADADIAIWCGSFAGFADIIASSSLYVGYDSAGQHAAAALGVPLICIFAGYPTLRMFHRWRPIAPNATVIRIDHPDPDPDSVLASVARALS